MTCYNSSQSSEKHFTYYCECWYMLLCGGQLTCTADPSRPAEDWWPVERLRGPEGETVRVRDGAPSVRTPSLAIREGALGYLVHAQPCLTHCDPMDCSPPGASVHGISQARILEWVGISASRGASRARESTSPASPALAGGCFITRTALQVYYCCCFGGNTGHGGS